MKWSVAKSERKNESIAMSERMINSVLKREIRNHTCEENMKICAQMLEVLVLVFGLVHKTSQKNQNQKENWCMRTNWFWFWCVGWNSLDLTFS